MPEPVLVSESPTVSGSPEWLEPSLHITPGRDPLGLATITTDRIIPRLVPGVLALSVRARYLSFYPFLLRQYEQRRLPASNSSLSDFMKAREYEFALAVQMCPRGCGTLPSGVVGKNNASPAVGEAPNAYERRASVESHLGGYGLYYRSPLVDLGIVAPAGSSLGEGTTPIDLLMRDRRAQRLADTFEEAIRTTTYYREYMSGTDPVPKDVLLELSQRSCLCRLDDYPQEQKTIRDALLEPSSIQRKGSVDQRRRSFAVYLWLMSKHPELVESRSAFHDSIWSTYVERVRDGSVLADYLSPWASLIAKEFMQDAMSTIWADVCATGGRKQSGAGLTPDEVEQLLREDLLREESIDILGEELRCSPDRITQDYGEEANTLASRHSLESLRRWTVDEGSAVAGITLLLILYQRIEELDPPHTGWLRVGSLSGERQPGLLRMGALLNEHLSSTPTLSDTMQWLVSHFVIRRHESIAYSKLPNFIFRFRWEEGYLRFYSELDIGRFTLNDIRQNALARLSQDLGLWVAVDGVAELTGPGRRFVQQVVGRS